MRDLLHRLLQAALAALLKLAFRLEVRGLEHYAAVGPRAVVVVNHVSFLDAVLLTAVLPRRPVFAINTRIAERWWMKPFLPFAEAVAVDPANPLATKTLIRLVQSERHCVIFPEGRITVTGALMKVYEGPGMVADKADAPVVPVRIDGAQYTVFSRLRGKVRRRLFPKITVTILEPRRFELPPGLKGRARRHMAGTRLYDVMSEMMFATRDTQRTLYQALCDARAVHGGRHAVVEDIERRPLSYGRLLLGARILGRKLARMTRPGEHVGVLLPNSSAAAVTFFALQAHGRVPAMLNFSAGSANLTAALQAAEIKLILTSRRFLQAANLVTTAAGLATRAKVVYLEDVRDRLTRWDKLAGLLARRWSRRPPARSSDPAVVLFTSGSEGTPKGVVLSHANLLANCFQLSARIDFNPSDIAFNALPMFHAFGLTGGLLLPLYSGVKTFLYPSPLHYRVVPALAYDTDATVIFGTDTFLMGYARGAHPYDFYNVRYVFAGAEKVKEETRQIYADKFGLRILEGYGATETAPVIAVATPMHYRRGSVGRVLPGIRTRLEPVEGIDDGGRLIVSGPNVMLGYLRAERPGVIEAAKDHTYDTGDIVALDGEGFMTILGRAKRFAKLGGEMISLAAVEAEIARLWPGHAHAVLAMPDARKGEQLVLVTDRPGPARTELGAAFRERGLSEIMVPKSIVVLDELPTLATGKVDYVALGALAKSKFANAAE